MVAPSATGATAGSPSPALAPILPAASPPSLALSGVSSPAVIPATLPSLEDVPIATTAGVVEGTGITSGAEIAKEAIDMMLNDKLTPTEKLIQIIKWLDLPHLELELRAILYGYAGTVSERMKKFHEIFPIEVEDRPPHPVELALVNLDLIKHAGANSTSPTTFASRSEASYYGEALGMLSIGEQRVYSPAIRNNYKQSYLRDREKISFTISWETDQNFKSARMGYTECFQKASNLITHITSSDSVDKLLYLKARITAMYQSYPNFDYSYDPEEDKKQDEIHKDGLIGMAEIRAAQRAEKLKFDLCRETANTLIAQITTQLNQATQGTSKTSAENGGPAEEGETMAHRLAGVGEEEFGA
ncbi:hypothetical protein CALCODRAFT_483709 [Calocera cornea HHB12733]|uniref:Uncharacterized protein n=1 Tax=Calocera cornea HHB12733 TaxID=1353952 RepID=A0A165FJ78_9BASI|nr:hypothetical protein CALCODRAFT_483709 [Calocera cornea HHB12733]